MDDVLRIVSACTAELEATAVAKGWRTLTELDFERAMWNATGARSATLTLPDRGVVSMDVLMPDRTAIELVWGTWVGDIAGLGFALSEGLIERAFVVCAASLHDWSARQGDWPDREGIVEARDAGALPVMLDGEPFRIRAAEIVVADGELLREEGPPRSIRVAVEVFAYDDMGDGLVRLFFATPADDVSELVVSESPGSVTVTVYKRRIAGISSDGFLQAEATVLRIGCLEVELADPLGERKLIDGSDGAALRVRDPNAAVAEDDWHLARALVRGCPRWVP